MKRISNLAYVLIGIGFLATGCSEDEIMKVTPANPGDAIVFGATASIENGSPHTRTAYGEKGDGFQVINWVAGDEIRIACAEAAQAKQADYVVQNVTPGSPSGDKESSASTLIKKGDGLQWGTGEHTFYAVYPSPAHFNVTDENQQPHTNLEDHTVTGVLGSVQVASDPKTEDNQTVYKPDMAQAYMAARAYYNQAKEGGEGVTLHFKPLVTAIEVEVKAGEINPNSSSSGKTLEITSLTLRSEKGNNLVGKFSADISGLNGDEATIKGATINDETPSDMSTSNVRILLPESKKLAKDESVVVTFFILPTAEFDENNKDLKLDVTFIFDGASTTKTCTLGKEIKAHRKYFFKNVTLPTMNTGDINSNWVSRLDDDILISQLSIPGAGNAASESSKSYREQTKSLTELWNLGVRCFELVTDMNNSNGIRTNLASCRIWCGGEYISTMTFGSALTTLKNLLKANPREFLIIICSYQADAGGRHPDYYVQSFKDSYSSGILDGINFVSLNSGSTVGDIRGKIAFVGKISQEGEDENLELVVPEWFTYIKGWGSLKDKWNKRYGSEYNPFYKHSYNGSKLDMEDRFFSYQNGNPKYTEYPTRNPDFSYKTNQGQDAWVQEWMRVVPKGGITKISVGREDRALASAYLMFTWPESYSEKLSNIKETLSKSKIDQNYLYINSLCGYYVDKTIRDSYTPLTYGSSVTVDGHNCVTGYYDGWWQNLGDGGKGGDFATYNKQIMSDVYDYVNSQAFANTTGPMGIVMMDYIGEGDKATKLSVQIYENNFSFPLKRGDGSSSPSPAPKRDASYSNGGNAIGWE